MNTLRNLSGQSFLIHKAGGTVVHLYPGRMVTLADEEINSSQIQRLIASNLASIQKIDWSAQETTEVKDMPTKPESEILDPSEQNQVKKKGDS